MEALAFFVQVSYPSLPFHFFVWKTVSVETLVLNSVLVPVLLLGFFIGVSLVKLISNLHYRRFILAVTAIGALILLFR